MLERATVRVLPLVNRTAEHAPVAAVCCNACRTCVTTNVLGLAAGAILGAVAAMRRLAGHVVRPR